MSGADQFYIFLVCALYGVLSGAIYDVIYCAVLPFKKSWVKIAGDLLFSVIFIALYIFLSLLFTFPAFRLYMFLGCALGFYLYLKSFHKIVAFLAGKVYNKIQAKISSTQKEKRVWHERCAKPNRTRRLQPGRRKSQ